MAFLGLMWGQQFQDPKFLMALGVIVIFFILSLFDMFHVGFLSNKLGGVAVAREGHGGDFFKGVLATLLATPCSGPFLGGTLFWASQQTPWVVFCVYFSVGIGMSVPFIAVVTIPPLKKMLPRPGPWMETFKQGSAFLMMGTLVYLIYLLDDETRVLALSIFVFSSFCGWLFHATRKAPLRLAVGLLFLSGLWVSWGLENSQPSSRSPKNSFSYERLQQARDEGQTVVVDFTADWCPNCKVNEKLVLESDEVRKAFKKADILFLVADITRKNPVAEKELKHLGGFSIPFLAIYPRGKRSQARTIRDVYTKKKFLTFLEESLV